MKATVPLDYSLMAQHVGPFGGVGTWRGGEWGECWCGYCGYTGRVLGPRMARCPERDGWHRWLRRCVDRHTA